MTVLERGRLFFFYRPRVSLHESHGIDDLQRFFFLMCPLSEAHWPAHGVKVEEGEEGGKQEEREVGHEKQARHEGRKVKKEEGEVQHQKTYETMESKCRLMMMGKKRFPKGHERFWGRVDHVGGLDKAKEALGQKEYDTATRGHRVTESARMCGEGLYIIATKRGSTHLAYVLEHPAEPGEVQEELGIEKQATYVMTVKVSTGLVSCSINRDAKNPSTNLSRPVQIPQEHQHLFGSRRFIPANPPSLLDTVGIEFLLIGAHADVVEDLGAEEGGDLVEAVEEDPVKEEDDEVPFRE
ncbi:hypothetical protein HDU96_003235 [Phlyctochytrium bullatum]|nr:hypothetical protein HDU96_003235 [Phlyctochytrium bullatum]